jgi:hypothetical protein
MRVQIVDDTVRQQQRIARIGSGQKRHTAIRRQAAAEASSSLCLGPHLPPWGTLRSRIRYTTVG